MSKPLKPSKPSKPTNPAKPTKIKATLKAKALSTVDLTYIKGQFQANLDGIVTDYLDVHPGATTVDTSALVQRALDYVKSDYRKHPEEYHNIQKQEDDYFRDILCEALGPCFGLPEEYYES